MATRRRTAIPADTKSLVLHESGYRCANPACRTILTLDIHHLDQVADGGADDPENLLALCPNCHALHHRGTIPKSSLRAWKQLLLSLNEAFDKRTVDLLLAINLTGKIHVSGDGVLQCAADIAAGLIQVTTEIYKDDYWIELSQKGKNLVSAWIDGDQNRAITQSAP